MRFKNPFDKIDYTVSIGLLLLGGGIAIKKPWLAACIVGAILIAFGMIAVLRR